VLSSIYKSPSVARMMLFGFALPNLVLPNLHLAALLHLNLSTKFLPGLFSAIAIKLTSSVDDVLWLAPFLTTNVGAAIRLQNAIVYLTVCLCQTGVAMVIASSGDAAIQWLTGDSEDAWSSDKILTVVAGTLLAVYTVKLVHEYFTEEDDEDGDKKEEEGGGLVAEGSKAAEDTLDSRDDSTVASSMELGVVGSDRSASKGEQQRCLKKGFPETKPASGSSGTPGLNTYLPFQTLMDLDDPNDDGVRRERSRAELKVESKDKQRQQTLFVIAFIGSIDDLTLFVPMLVGKGFDWLQLVLGAVIAASTIVMICLFIGLCKPLADFLSQIPLALIVAVFATSLLVKGYTLEPYGYGAI